MSSTWLMLENPFQQQFQDLIISPLHTSALNLTITQYVLCDCIYDSSNAHQVDLFTFKCEMNTKYKILIREIALTKTLLFHYIFHKHILVLFSPASIKS